MGRISGMLLDVSPSCRLDQIILEAKRDGERRVLRVPLGQRILWKLGWSREALRQYGPIDVGYDYADVLLDCEKCLKQSNALGECDYLLQNKGEKDECPRPGKLWACLNQITGRIKSLREWKSKNKMDAAKGKGALWGYRRLFPGGFDIPRPFVPPSLDE